jgi:hypothetical protein
MADEYNGITMGTQPGGEVVTFHKNTVVGQESYKAAAIRPLTTSLWTPDSKTRSKLIGMLEARKK